MNTFYKQYAEQGIDYKAYRDMVSTLLEAGKTTGNNHSEAMVNYTQMNQQRMKRLDKQVTLNDELKEAAEALEGNYIWLVLTEAWCGDAAQNVPVLAKVADAAEDNITLKLVLRDEYPELMERHLTNGGKGIPKLVVLDADTFEPLTEWGPRPKPAQQMVMDHKENPLLPYKEFVEQVHKWYADDRTQTTQQELLALLKESEVAVTSA